MVRRTDRPRPHGSARLSSAEREIAASLRQRVTEITTAWHEALCEQMEIRPEAIFPTDELLDHMHLVVEHVVELIEANGDIPPRTLEALRDVAEHWLNAGYSVEEALLHFRILNRVMHEEFRRLIGTTDAAVSAEAAAWIAESLSHGSGLVQVVVVGAYRDRGEERLMEYASMLSHEIRSPLSAGLAAIQVIDALDQAEGGEADAKRREALERTEESLWQANRMLDAVRSLSAPRSETALRELKPLREIVGTILTEFESQSDGVSIQWQGQLPDTEVPYDSVMLALHNLVQNAVAYSDPGKPERWVRISCRYDEEENRWILDVSDNGVGIPKAEQELIFKRFRRGKSAEGQGFGLGLSIVRQAAWRINGDVAVESEPGEGSTFSFAFPARNAQSNA